MDIAVTVVKAVGGMVAIIGLTWLLTGALDFFGGRKNNDGQRQENGMTAMISGGVLAALSGGVTTAIVSAMQNIGF